MLIFDTRAPEPRADPSADVERSIDPASIALPPTHTVDVTEYLEELLGRL